MKAKNQKYRSCMSCSLINTSSDFKTNGCKNCQILSRGREHDFFLECTTSKYNGIIGMFNPEKSWVAKWQHINDKIPGFYSITVDGFLPEDYVNILHDNGKQYHNRSDSFSI
ncbi:Transcription elongation factor SPT4 [Dictyocoela muelleri]|nr:Transcription elongation factor SPT4 [Dictyocoela muelleri]